METAFSVCVAIVMAVALAAFFANNQMQLPGQPSAGLPGAFSGPVESAGLSASPGLSQKSFK